MIEDKITLHRDTNLFGVDLKAGVYVREAGKWVRKKEWVGLSINEAKDFYDSKWDRAELINKIDEFLEEKNK